MGIGEEGVKYRNFTMDLIQELVYKPGPLRVVMNEKQFAAFAYYVGCLMGSMHVFKHRFNSDYIGLSQFLKDHNIEYSDYLNLGHALEIVAESFYDRNITSK